MILKSFNRLLLGAALTATGSPGGVMSAVPARSRMSLRICGRT